MTRIEFIKMQLKDEIAHKRARLERIKNYAAVLRCEAEIEALMRAWQIVCSGEIFDKESKELRKIEKSSAWSEEDERMLNSFLHKLEVCDLLSTKEIVWIRNKLKSLSPQKQWKPSDEQMEAFEHFVRSIGESGYASPYDNNTKLLYSLLKQLKKLKE